MTRWLRRALLLSSCAFLSMFFAWRTVRAELAQRALDASAPILDLPAAWSSAAPRELWLNGGHVRVLTGLSDLPLPALMSRLEQSCRARSQLAPSRLRELAGTALPSLLDGVLRADAPQSGLIACFELGGRPLGVSGLLGKLQRFARELDLAELGNVHVVRAAARPQGTFFVVVSTLGALPLTKLFPAAGDAPGLDFSAAGRPLDSRRVFTALQEGGEPTIVIYESGRALAPLLDEYAGRLVRAGFEQLGVLQEQGSRSVLLQQHGSTLLVMAARARGRSLVSVIALDRGFVRNSRASSTDSRAVMRQRP